MAKTIQFTEYDREKYRVLTNILGLKDLDIVREAERSPNEPLRLYCASRWDVGLCPDCLQLSRQIHDYPKQRKIYDAPLQGQKLVLIFDSLRFDCDQCDKPFTQFIQDVVPDCTYTQRLYEEVSNPKNK